MIQKVHKFGEATPKVKCVSTPDKDLYLTVGRIYEDLTYIVKNPYAPADLRFIRNNNSVVIGVKSSHLVPVKPHFTKDLSDFETKDDWAIKHLFEDLL